MSDREAKDGQRLLDAVTPAAVRGALAAVAPLDHGAYPTCTADVLVAAAETYARVVGVEVPTPSAAANVLWARELAGRPEDPASRMSWAVRAMDERGWTWEHDHPTTASTLAGPSPSGPAAASWIRAIPVPTERVEACLRRGFLVAVDLPLAPELATVGSDGHLEAHERLAAPIRHVVLAHTLDAKTATGPRIRFRNSWGADWGDHGDGSFSVGSRWRAEVRDAWVLAPDRRPILRHGYRETKHQEGVVT